MSLPWYAGFAVVVFIMGMVWVLLPEPVEPCCIDKRFPNTCDVWLYERDSIKGGEKTGRKWCPATGEVR